MASIPDDVKLRAAVQCIESAQKELKWNGTEDAATAKHLAEALECLKGMAA